MSSFPGVSFRTRGCVGLTRFWVACLCAFHAQVWRNECLSSPHSPLPTCVWWGPQQSLLLGLLLSEVVEKDDPIPEVPDVIRGTPPFYSTCTAIILKGKDLRLGILIVSSLCSVLKPTHHTDCLPESSLDFCLSRSNFISRAFWAFLVTKLLFV